MFGKIKNLDTAFRQVRIFSLVVVSGSILLSVFALEKSFRTVGAVQDRIYVLAQGKALEAYASKRGDNLVAEAKHHIENFHQLFFTLIPDEVANRKNLKRAFYLADQSAHRVYSDLSENGFYAGIVSGNVSQTLTVDSILLNFDQPKIQFRCFGIQTITRSSSMTKRSLITEGSLREIARSDHNPHGLLIEGWKTLENKDIQRENRKP